MPPAPVIAKREPGARAPRVECDDSASRGAEARAGESQISELLLLIHQGPQEAIPWSQAFTLMCRALSADHVAVILRRPSPRIPALIIDASTERVRKWRGGYSYYSVYTRDPFSGLPQDHVVSVDDVLGAAAWEGSEFYQKYIRPLDVRYVLGADLVTDNGVKCRFRVSRSSARGNFGAYEREICNALLPHIKISIDINARLDAQRMELGAYGHAMEQLLVGVAIFDEQGELIRTNTVAKSILAEGDGLHIMGGRLRATLERENREINGSLKAALDDAASGREAAGTVLSISRRTGRPNVGVLIRPIPLGMWSQQHKSPAVAVFLRDPERSTHSSHEAMRTLFGLTGAEALLANHLVDGYSLDEAAALLRIRRNTARAQLRSIFAKTGARRQSMLVRMLLNSVASMSDPEDAARSAADPNDTDGFGLI